MRFNRRDAEELREEPDKQAITGNITYKYYGDWPALQVEQVKMGHFEGIYEDNA